MIHFTYDDLILVTGASSGLGAESCVLLNSLGARVIGVGRNAKNLAETKDRCPHPENFFPEYRDLVDDIDTITTWVRTLVQHYGKLVGLLCCAGIGNLLPAAMQTDAEIRRIFDLNFFALFQVARGFLDRRNNQGRGSSIVFLASSSYERDNAGLSAYASSKGAVISLMRSLACEYLKQGIRVNSISPGFILTPMTKATYTDAEAIANTYPLGPGQPSDVAKTAIFLLSSCSRWLTGQNIVLDGGRGLL